MEKLSTPQAHYGNTGNVKKEIINPAAHVFESHVGNTPSKENNLLNTSDAHQPPEAVPQSTKSPRSLEEGHNNTAQRESEKTRAIAPLALDNEDSNDPNLVSWDGPDDPANPLNWSSWLKFTNFALVSGLCFIIPLASSMFAPGIPQVMEEFNSTNIELASFVVSVFVLGFAFGPLLLAPASELWGRLWVYHITNVLFVVMTVACALSTNIEMLIAFRFLAGCFGAAPLSNSAGTVFDLMRQSQRGMAMSALSLGPLL